MKTKEEVIKEAEEWKPCLGYENFYEASNLGSIRSLRKNKNLKPTINKYGYCKVSLTGDNSYKTVNVHRIIAQTFIPNPNNKPQVNHIDGDKSNNRVDNLEWTTREENMKHAHLNGLMKLPKGINHHYFNIKSDLHPRAKSLINIETKEIYGCIKDCAKVLDIKESTLRGWLSDPRINPTKIIYLNDYKNNNGWISINSVEDLPIEEGKYYVVRKFHGDIQTTEIYGNIQETKHVSNSWIWNYSHYQRIIEPLKPLY